MRNKGREAIRRALRGHLAQPAAFVAEAARESATCVVCGRGAVVRVYTPQGRQIGACAQHKDAANWEDHWPTPAPKETT